LRFSHRPPPPIPPPFPSPTLLRSGPMTPVSAALTAVPPPDPAPAGAPGPFSLGNPDWIRQLLTQAGFDDVDVSEVAESICLGENATDAVDFWQGSGTARLLLDDVDAETERRAIDAVRGALRPHEGPEGIWLGSAAWLVSATRAQPSSMPERTRAGWVPRSPLSA